MTNEPHQYRIETGVGARIDKGGFFNNTIELVYSGMPNDQTFALSPIIQGVSSVLQRDACVCSPTIYYRRDASEINVLRDRFKVVTVSPDEIVLQYLKK